MGTVLNKPMVKVVKREQPLLNILSKNGMGISAFTFCFRCSQALLRKFVLELTSLASF